MTSQNMKHVIDCLPMDETPVGYIRKLCQVDYVTARMKLNSYELKGSSHTKRIGDLSKSEQELIAKIPKNYNQHSMTMRSCVVSDYKL